MKQLTTIDETYRQKIQMLIDEFGNQNKLATVIGKDAGQVSQWKNGTRGLSPEMAREIEKKTGKPRGWLDQPLDAVIELSTGYNLPDGYIRFAVLDAPAQMGKGIESHSDFVEIVNFVAVAEAWAKRNLGGSLNHIQVITSIGDSMSGTIEAGEILFIDTSINFFAGEGIYVIYTPNGRRAKRLQMLQNGSLKIISDNSRYEPEIISGEELNNIHIIGKLRGSWGFKSFD